MREILASDGSRITVDDVDFEYLNQFIWSITKDSCENKYATRKIGNGTIGYKSSYLHREVATAMNLDLYKETDHIDRNSLNCTRLNLREATHSQNLHNRGAQKNNTTSGVKGVSWCAREQKYRAQITINKEHYSLGYHNTVDEAKQVVNAFGRRMLGEFYAEA